MLDWRKLLRQEGVSLLAITVVVLALSLRLLYLLDPDFGWHLYFGRQMAESGQLVGETTRYSSFPNIKVVDHQWLSHLVFHWLYQLGGYTSLIAATVLGGLQGCLVLYADARRRGAAPLYALVAVLVFALSLQVVYGVRLQVLFIAWLPVIVWVARYVEAAWKRAVLYFGLYLILSNLHGGFIPFICVPVLLELDRISWQRGERARSFWRYLGVVGAAVLGLLPRPELMEYLWLQRDYLLDASYKAGIQEWQPTLSFPVHWGAVVVPLSLVLFSLVVTSFWKQKRLGEMLFLGVVTYVGLRHIRFFPAFMLVATPYVAVALQHAFPAQLSAAGKLITQAGIALLVALQVSGLGALNYLRWPFDPVGARGYPGELVAAAQATGVCQDQPIFNTYAWGGYLIGLANLPTVFVDGASPQAKTPSGKSVLDEYNAVFRPERVEELLNAYSIQCVYLDVTPIPKPTWLDRVVFSLPEEVGLTSEQILDRQLAGLHGWQEVERVGNGVLYARVDQSSTRLRH